MLWNIALQTYASIEMSGLINIAHYHVLRSCETTFLRAVDAAEADTLRTGVGQDFDGGAVEDGDDRAASARSRGEV